MQEKDFHLEMYDDVHWTKAEYPGWEITIRHKQGCICLRFRPFSVHVKCNDERDGLWDLESIELYRMSTYEEIRQSANLLKRITKDLGFGKWHMLPHELIRRGYKPYANRFPAKYGSVDWKGAI